MRLQKAQKGELTSYLIERSAVRPFGNSGSPTPSKRLVAQRTE
jgi:hypothetical protein